MICFRRMAKLVRLGTFNSETSWVQVPLRLPIRRIMLKLAIIPLFPFKQIYNEFGDYAIVIPQNLTIVTVMKCTSLHWAFQDAIIEMKDQFDCLFGDGNYSFQLLLKPTEEELKTINAANEPLNIKAYWKRRNTLKLPPWEDGRDKYRYHTANVTYEFA